MASNDTSVNKEVSEGDKQPERKLDDLNDDCLENTFMYLVEPDLVSLVGASRRFEVVAERVYKRKFGEWILFNSMTRNDKCNLRRLRSFGHLYKGLYLKIDLAKFDYRLIDALIKHCGGHLKILSISFVGVKGISRAQGKKYCRVFLQRLSTNFPKLEALLYGHQCVNYFQRLEHVANHFPCLIILDVVVINIEDFKEIVRSNPQLQQLTAHFEKVNVTRELIKFIDETLPGLTDLCVIFHSVSYVASYVPLYFKQLKSLSIMCELGYPAHVLNFLAPSGENLETVNYLEEHTFCTSVVPILNRFKKLQKLDIGLLLDEHLFELAANLPEIAIFETTATLLTADGIISVLDLWSNLVQFNMKFDGDMGIIIFEDLKELLKGSKWNVSSTTDAFNYITISPNK